jgi:hypothetical protein
MKPEHARLIEYLEKVLIKIEDVMCDRDESKETKQELYSAQIEVLDKFSLVKE